MNKCIVCNRIPPKEVFKVAHVLFKSEGKKIAHALALRACEIINEVDRKKRMFFCGRRQSVLLGGLLWLIALNDNKRITQRDAQYAIIDSAPTLKYGEGLTEVSVRNSAKRWLSAFPEFFPNVRIIKRKNRSGSYKPSYRIMERVKT